MQAAPADNDVGDRGTPGRIGTEQSNAAAAAAEPHPSTVSANPPKSRTAYKKAWREKKHYTDVMKRLGEIEAEPIEHYVGGMDGGTFANATKVSNPGEFRVYKTKTTIWGVVAKDESGILFPIESERIRRLETVTYGSKDSIAIRLTGAVKFECKSERYILIEHYHSTRWVKETDVKAVGNRSRREPVRDLSKSVEKEKHLGELSGDMNDKMRDKMLRILAVNNLLSKERMEGLSLKKERDPYIETEEHINEVNGYVDQGDDRAAWSVMFRRIEWFKAQMKKLNDILAVFFAKAARSEAALVKIVGELIVLREQKNAIEQENGGVDNLNDSLKEELETINDRIELLDPPVPDGEDPETYVDKKKMGELQEPTLVGQ